MNSLESSSTHGPFGRKRTPAALWRAAAVAALLGAAAAGPAAAADLYWSIGLQQPGVQVVVSQLPTAPVVLVPVHRMVPPPLYHANWTPPGHAWQAPHGHRYGYGRHDGPRGHWKAERHHHRHEDHGRRDDRDPRPGHRR